MSILNFYICFSNQFLIKIDLGLNVKALLIVAVSTIVLLYIVKFLVSYLHQKKIDKIIESYKSKKSSSDKIQNGTSKKTSKKRNPFVKRERKSGLTWGGGNVKGANPTRGTKKEFLK